MSLPCHRIAPRRFCDRLAVGRSLISCAAADSPHPVSTNHALAHRRLRRRVAWAAAVLLVVSIPLSLFTLGGLPHFFRNAQVRTVVALEAEGMPPDVASAPFAPGFALVTGTTLSAGNTMEVLANGDATFPRLWQDLGAARRSITAQIYYAGPGVVADTVTRILAERARAGIDVYFLYDAFGAADLPRRNLDALRAAGVHVAEFRPVRWYTLDRANHRSHVRGIVVDGAVAYTGGFGFDDKFLGGGRRPQEWRETNARFSGPAVAQLQTAFIAKWAEATGELLTGKRLLALADADATAAGSAARVSGAALIHSPPLTGSTTAERLIALLIASARRRLYIANAYFVPDADFVRLLVAAARRGVDVRLLTNGAQGDVKLARLAGRGRYETLLAAGVRIYEYRPAAMHAKTFVVDGTLAAVTTMNFDNRSLAYNNEVALVARDATIGAAMEAMFLDDLQVSDEIRRDAFVMRSRWQRLLEQGASVLSSLL